MSKDGLTNRNWLESSASRLKRLCSFGQGLNRNSMTGVKPALRASESSGISQHREAASQLGGPIRTAVPSAGFCRPKTILRGKQ